LVAGGAGRPIISFGTICGHGRVVAAGLERLGLTDVVEEPVDLLAAMDRLMADPAARSERIARGRRLFVADAADLLVARLRESEPAVTAVPGVTR
jgi:hypothetical protein